MLLRSLGLLLVNIISQRPIDMNGVYRSMGNGMVYQLQWAYALNPPIILNAVPQNNVVRTEKNIERMDYVKISAAAKSLNAENR